MDTKTVEEFCREKGKFIADMLSQRYSSADFDVDPYPIEKEIYDMSTVYAQMFVFERGKSLNEESRQDLRSEIGTRFSISSRKLQKLVDTELIAHSIKSRSIDFLSKKGLLIV